MSATRSPRPGCRSSPRNKYSKLLQITQECDHMNAVNNNVPSSKRQVQAFAQWYKNLMDGDRNGLGLYVADDGVLQWFGRTIKTKKRITGFIKYDMNCSNHSFTSVDSCPPIVLQLSEEKSEKTGGAPDSEVLAVPLADTPPNIVKSFSRVALRSTPRKRSRRESRSPELVCSTAILQFKRARGREEDVFELGAYSPGDSKLPVVKYNLRKSSISPDGKLTLSTPKKSSKRRATPGSEDKNPPAKYSPNELTEKSRLPIKYMEANCVLEFIKMRNKRGADIYKWERPCKLQIAFSEDPVGSGEYVIWSIIYSDNIKCKRNLMAAFDAVS